MLGVAVRPVDGAERELEPRPRRRGHTTPGAMREAGTETLGGEEAAACGEQDGGHADQHERGQEADAERQY